jgi:hypothetical protein
MSRNRAASSAWRLSCLPSPTPDPDGASPGFIRTPHLAEALLCSVSDCSLSFWRRTKSRPALCPQRDAPLDRRHISRRREGLNSRFFSFCYSVFGLPCSSIGSARQPAKPCWCNKDKAMISITYMTTRERRKPPPCRNNHPAEDRHRAAASCNKLQQTVGASGRQRFGAPPAFSGSTNRRSQIGLPAQEGRNVELVIFGL